MNGKSLTASCMHTLLSIMEKGAVDTFTKDILDQYTLVVFGPCFQQSYNAHVFKCPHTDIDEVVSHLVGTRDIDSVMDDGCLKMTLSDTPFNKYHLQEFYEDKDWIYNEYDRDQLFREIVNQCIRDKITGGCTRVYSLGELAFGKM